MAAATSYTTGSIASRRTGDAVQVCPIKFPTTSTDVPAPFPSALDYYEVFEFVTGVSDSGPAGPPLVDMVWILKLTRIGNIVHLSSLQDMHFVTTTAPTTAPSPNASPKR